MLAKEFKRALRRRGLSPLEIHRTIRRRGVDATHLAFVLTEKVTLDTAVALLEGLLHAPYGAQRAAEVLRDFAPDVDLPTRSVGVGIHAGRLFKLLRRAVRAVPYVGQPARPPEVVTNTAGVIQAVVQAAIAAFKTAPNWQSEWSIRTWAINAPRIRTRAFRHGPVTLRVVEEQMTFTSARWVARADVSTPGGVVRLNADALIRLGIDPAVKI